MAGVGVGLGVGLGEGLGDTLGVTTGELAGLLLLLLLPPVFPLTTPGFPIAIDIVAVGVGLPAVGKLQANNANKSATNIHLT